MLRRLLQHADDKKDSTAKEQLPLTGRLVYTNLIDLHQLQLHQFHRGKGQRSQKTKKFFFIRNQAIFFIHIKSFPNNDGRSCWIMMYVEATQQRR